MSVRSASGLKWPLYFWSGLHREVAPPQLPPAYERGYRTAPDGAQHGRTSLGGARNVRTSLGDARNVRASLIGRISSFSRAALDARRLANVDILTLKSKLSKSRIHCTNSGDTVDNVPNMKIPISLVTSILQRDSEVKPKKTKSKTQTAVDKAEYSNKSSGPSSTLALKVRHSEPAISVTPQADPKAVVPYVSSTALKTVWRGSNSARPKVEDLQNGSDFKGTYERLKRLGLLKTRMSNCHLSMTSPSGKTKTPAEIRGAALGQAVKKTKPPPRKPTEIKSKFLQNSVVLKVQHFYHSQGKEMPEELKGLTRGTYNRYPTQSNSFTELKRRGYQVYPCTSPSSSYFARTIKKSE